MDVRSIDKTGLSGTFDFTLEFTPELNWHLPPGVNFQPDTSGPTLEEAKVVMDVLVLDHVERPAEN